MTTPNDLHRALRGPALATILAAILATILATGLAAGAPALAQDVASAPEAGTDSIPADSPVRGAMLRAEAAVDQIVAIPDELRTFENTVGAIDDLLARLELDTNMPMFLAYVSTDTGERDDGRRAEEDVTNWLVDLSQREDLARAVQAFASGATDLGPERARLLDYVQRDFRRAGMKLSEPRREELGRVKKELTRLSIEFEQNIREDETRVLLTPQELWSMPEDYRASLTRVGDVCLVGLSYPEFLPIMDLCDNETTRQKVWLAYKRRGGTQNVRVLEEILVLRAKAAALLGYDHPADYEIEVRMAKDAATVMEFYENLRPLVREKARLDHEEFLAAKRRHTGDDDAVLYPWDFSFYKKRLLKDKYSVDSELVREYFPLDRVIDGLFSITQSLYGITYTDITERVRAEGRSLWHEDVRVYEVTDVAAGAVLGEFSFDLHPRPNKYGHAAQWGLAQHKVWGDGRVSRPVAALVCNFTKPTADKPSLLSREEVETFFHEFGHCLHTLLSEAGYWRFSGTNVERDFVEAPSQMFENWVWDADALATFARHYETGEPFPRELLDGMVRARYLGSGMVAERQFFYGLYDMRCHLTRDGAVDTTQLGHDLWGEEGDGVELYAAVPETYFQAAFGHLTGYQAGYYGYQWSLLYACDMFQRFKGLGLLDPEAGMYYRRKILARGGTVDGLDLVRDYLRREPDMTAYLKHLGLTAESDEASADAQGEPGGG